MPLQIEKTIRFGSFMVNQQVFHLSPLSFALVNLKPLLPGHVLVSPQRVVPRVSDLSAAEVSDLFLAVQKVGRMIQRVYGGSALNIAIQDGEAAGQSVPHVHAHIIPRKPADLDHKGGSDAIYDMMDGNDGNVRRQLEQQQQQQQFPKPDADEQRQPRDADEMRKEAEMLAEEMEKEV